jgi:hypothetical protein
MTRVCVPLSFLVVVLATASASAQPRDRWEILAQAECVAGHYQAGNAIFEQLLRDTGDARYLRAQALCLQVVGRWAEAAGKYRSYLTRAQGLSAGDFRSTEEQIQVSEMMASRQGSWQTVAQISPAAPSLPLAARPVQVVPQPPDSNSVLLAQATAMTSRSQDSGQSECTKCYPGGLSPVPAADIPMAGIGAGLLNASQFATSGTSSLSTFAVVPYLELGAPGFRNLSLHYHAVVSSWVATGSGGQSQYDTVVSQHTAGLKIVPYYNGRGDSFLLTLNASLENASMTKASGRDYVSPHGLLLYSGFVDPLVFKLGIGGGADIAITRGLKNSGQAQYFGQLGALVLRRNSAYSYLVAELVGTVDLRLHDKNTIDHGGSSSSGSYSTRTETTLDATHNMDGFFGVIAKGSAYQFKLGIDLPVTNKDRRMDYALVTGLGFLY